MPATAIRTKAEQSLARSYEAVAARLAGGDRGEIAGLRRAAIERLAAEGLPSRRAEAWRYTDLKARLGELHPPVQPEPGRFSEKRLAAALGRELLAVPAVVYAYANGQLASWSHGPLITDAPGFTIGRLKRAIEDGLPGLPARLASPGLSDDPIAQLNLAFGSDGAVLQVADGAQLDVPIHLVYLSDVEQPGAVHTRTLIEVGAGARVTILESHVGAGAAARQTSHVTSLVAGDGARIEHLKLLAGPGSTHLGTWEVRLGAGAEYRALQLSLSPDLARHQLLLTFAGEGASASCNAAFLGRGQSHVDTTMVIDHAVPGCTSRELVKGVLDGSARGVFQGKVIVRPGAQKTDGKQMAKALMLADTAEFDSKPELEIYADDVACGHGSTSAELDEDQIFYLMARGLPYAEARALLVEAFVGEVLDTVASDGLRAAFRARAAAWLAEETPS